MAAGIIGAIFQGISSIGNVAVSKTQERTVDKQAMIQEGANNSAESIAQIELIKEIEAENFKKIALIVFSTLVIMVLIIYLK